MRFFFSNYESQRRQVSRRQLLAGTVAGVAAMGVRPLFDPVARAIEITERPSQAVGLSSYQDDGQVFIRWNNAVALGYRAHRSQKFPYFAPLSGPVTGLPLTTESSLPYPHHRGLWLGCEPLNGGNYWSDGPLDKGHIRSTGPQLDYSNSTQVQFHDICKWERPGAQMPLKDLRRFTFSIPSERIRLLEVELTLTAQEDIEIEEAKHSFFALRATADISPLYGGFLSNSNGENGAVETFGKPARWCGYFGKRAATNVVEGIAILDHPENFGGNCPWFTRHYGHLSPSPFNFLKSPWLLEQGRTLNLRYCVVLHSGSPHDAGLDSIHKQWVERSGWFTTVRGHAAGKSKIQKSSY
jgi:hypothetical protein